MVMKPREYQKRALEEVRKADQTGVLAMGLGTGKAQPLDSGVLTRNGFVRMGDVCVGDWIVTPTNEDAQVTGVFPQGVRPTYRVTLADGRSVLADADHLWTLCGRRRNDRTSERVKAVVKTTDIMSRWSYDPFIQAVQPIDLYGAWDTWIDPYMVGLLVGDGGLSGGTVMYTTTDAGLVDYFAKQLEALPNNHHITKCGTEYDHRISSTHGKPNLLLSELRRLGIQGHTAVDKRLPSWMLNTSKESRLALLQGLFDTDGTVEKNAIDYCVANETLRDQVAYMVQSLGGKATKTEKYVRLDGWDTARTYYRVRCVLPENIVPVRLDRHKARRVFGGKYTGEYVAVRSVEYAGEMETQCIMVDHPDHEYITDGFVRTHNTLTATFAAQETEPQVVLIVAPLRTRDGWVRHVLDIVGTDLRCIDGKKAGKDNEDALRKGEPGWYWVNWELMVSHNKEKRYDGHKKKMVFKPMSKAYDGVKVDVVIFDEVHRASNHSSLNFGVGSRINRAHTLCLSATPAGNKPVNIWSALTLCWPKKWGGWWAFADRYFEETYNPFSDLGKSYGEETRPGLVRSLAPAWAEVTQEEAYPEMPEVVVERIKVPLSRQQRKQYVEWKDDALAWLDSHPVALDLPAMKDLRLRQATLGALSSEPRTRFNKDKGEVETYDYVWFDKDCQSSKIDALLDLLGDLPPDEPVVVWCHSQRFMVPLMYRLKKAGYSAIEVSGRSKDDWRDLERGKAQILCAVVEALAEGADGMQNVCATEVWLSMSNSVIMNQQGAGRLHRGGQTRSVKRYLIEAENTIDDEVVSPRLEKKYRALKESGLI